MQISSIVLIDVTLLVGATGAVAQGRAVEFPGVKDPALISRCAGSALHDAAVEPFASMQVPARPGRYGPRPASSSSTRARWWKAG